MKIKAFFQLALYGLLVVASSCEEKNDLINFKSDDYNTLKLDSSYVSGDNDTAQNKNVLLEDFTGVRCINCPRAQLEAKKIQTQFPGRVVVSSIHVTDFAVPYKESKYDFRTTDGSNLHTLLGGKTSLPVGTIDRKKHGSDTTLFMLDYQWKSRVTNQLALPTPVNIVFMDKVFDDEKQTCKVNIKVTYTQAVSVPQYLSAFVSESELIDPQLTTVGVNQNYNHSHAFRAAMQPNNGLKLGDDFQKGQSFIVSLIIKMPENTREQDKWNMENCTLSALIHERQDKFDVIHVQETHLK